MLERGYCRNIYLIREGARYLCVLLDGGRSIQEANDQANNYPMHYTHLAVEGIPVHLDEVHQMSVRDSDSP